MPSASTDRDPVIGRALITLLSIAALISWFIPIITSAHEASARDALHAENERIWVVSDTVYLTDLAAVSADVDDGSEHGAYLRYSQTDQQLHFLEATAGGSRAFGSIPAASAEIYELSDGTRPRIEHLQCRIVPESDEERELLRQTPEARRCRDGRGFLFGLQHTPDDVRIYVPAGSIVIGDPDQP